MSLSVHIKKDFGGFRLDVNLEHESGITGLLGASGCGKSMTLKCIAGIVTPDEGRIELNGRALFDSARRINLKPQVRGVGYLFQNYALFPNMTVEKNILCGLKKEKDRSVRQEKLTAALTMMELEELRGSYPHQLSGGQQQRAALARILVSEPELLLLDEPFSALDAYLRDSLQIQVKELLERFGKDVLLVSHSRDEVYHLCGQVALIDGGRILGTGRTKAVFADPGTPVGAVLTGCKNIAEARKTGEYEVEVPAWGVRLKTAALVKDSVCAVGLRAHYFNARARENIFPVTYAGRMEEPFETTVLFRYEGQDAGTPPVWWRLPKDRVPDKMPEQLGIAPQNVLLLYPEKDTEDQSSLHQQRKGYPEGECGLCRAGGGLRHGGRRPRRKLAPAGEPAVRGQDRCVPGEGVGGVRRLRREPGGGGSGFPQSAGGQPLRRAAGRDGECARK